VCTPVARAGSSTAVDHVRALDGILDLAGVELLNHSFGDGTGWVVDYLLWSTVHFMMLLPTILMVLYQVSTSCAYQLPVATM
jgi:hypothetical protein